MKENPNWIWVRISSFSDSTYAWIKGERYSYNPRLRRACQPTQALAGSISSHFWNPYPTFPGRVHDLYGCLNTVVGRPYGRFSDFGYLDPCRTQAPYLRFGAQSSNFGPPSLGYTIAGHQVMVTTVSTHRVGPIPTPCYV